MTELNVIDRPVPRGLMFVEQVKFTEPYSLQLIGGDDQRLETFLAQKGIRSENDLRDSLDTEYHPKDKPIVTEYPPIIVPPGNGGNGGRPPGGWPPGGVLYPCGQIPVGGIIMWSGTIADIPECYALCNGTPPTPDLRNRFIVGAGVDALTLGFYQVGDTGGSDEVDISHLHAAGTLVADNESAHTHGIGTYAAANESSHTHGFGTLGTDTEANHTHGPGSYDTDNDTHDHSVDAGTTASDTHQHDALNLVANNENTHTHTSGTYVTDVPIGTTVVQSGSGTTVASSTHTHDILNSSSTTNHQHTISGLVENDAHSHGPGNLDTDNDTHDHAVNAGVSGVGGSHAHDIDSGNTGTGSAHTHTLSGDSAAGTAHGHTISGNTATGGDTTHDNRPQYYALAFIMRIL